MSSIVPPGTPTQDHNALALLTRVCDLLHELYEPTGVLVFWSSRITYLDTMRPCDVWRDRDFPNLERLERHLLMIAEGNL